MTRRTTLLGRGRPAWMMRGATAAGALALAVLAFSVPSARAAAPGITLSLTPSSIRADGTSTSTATATVTDANGQPVVGDAVTIAAPGLTVGPTIDRLDGSYAATILGSTTPGRVIVTATDATTPQSAQATLVQIGPPAAISVSLSPTSIVANGASTSTALATVVDSAGDPVAGDGLGFSSADSGIQFGAVTDHGDGTYSAQVTSSFHPGTPTIRATDNAGVSGNATLTETLATTATAIRASATTAVIGTPVTFTARVDPVDGGAIIPTGEVQFLDAGSPIEACRAQPLTAAGASATATCTVTYANAGAHLVSAVYAGADDLAGSRSSATTLTARYAGTIKAAVQWTFVSTTSSTSVLRLAVSGAAEGSTVVVSCRGGGCPFASHSSTVPPRSRCGRHGARRCQARGELDLTSQFAKRRLRPGAQLVVGVTRSGWLGRYVTFDIRSGRAPATRTICVPAGSAVPAAC